MEFGRRHFIQLMAKSLIPKYGPKALLLAFDSEISNKSAEDLLAKDLIQAGAIAVCSPNDSNTKTFKLYSVSDPQNIVQLASPSYAMAALSKPLSGISASFGQTIHPETPQKIVDSLLRLAANGLQAVKLFSEFKAAECLLIHDVNWQPRKFEDWLSQVVILMRELEKSRLSLPSIAEQLRKLREKAVLPTIGGGCSPWQRVWRSLKAPPTVPGVSAPPILHQTLYRSPILKEGSVKVPIFKLDECLSGRDFSKVIPEGRRKFFHWLKKGHVNIAPKTLAEIATYPIWPAEDESYHPLDYFCRPREQYQQQILAETRTPPAFALVTFAGLRNSSNGSLRLRKTLNDSEIENWHAVRMAKVRVLKLEEDISILQDAVNNTEEIMTRLRKDDVNLPGLGPSHLTLSKANDLLPVQSLHVPTQKVAACSLMNQDLVAGDHHNLYTYLGAKTHPDLGAILRALRNEPTKPALFPRLSAYQLAGGNLRDLGAEKIIFVKGTLLAPNTLSFPSSTDWWGEWKTPLDDTTNIPENASLLEGIGVVKSALREELSRSFFDWLAENPSAVTRHRQQIVRHWNDRRHGPLKWLETVPDKMCILVRDRNGGMSLVSRKKAVSPTSQIFLPDFEAVEQQVLENSSRARLAIINAANVDGSILANLKEAGIRSLKAFAGRPARIMIGSESTSDNELDAEFTLIKSRKILDTLPRRLPHFDVFASDLQRSWRRLLTDLAGVRLARNMTAIYVILNHEYEVSVNSGVDEKTHQVCVSGHIDKTIRFYAAISGHIFEVGTSSLYPYGLMQAVHAELQQELFEQGDYTSNTERENSEDNTSSNDGDPDAPEKGHGISEKEINPVAPNPGILRPILNPTYTIGRHKKKATRSHSNISNTKRHSVEEDEQIQALKSEHYAWHCQACLGERDVLHVTPPRSYVYLPLHRRALIEAHHVQHLQNEGEVGASNLLILCKFHHEILGDALSKELVQAGLSSAIALTRHFPIDQDGKDLKAVPGLLASIKLDSTPFKIELFFTEMHAKLWR